MYVRFTAPTKAVSTRLGTKIAEAAIGPVNPALPDCELRSFGIFQLGDKLTVSVPVGGTNYPHIVGRMTVQKVKDEDGTESVVTGESAAGKKQLEWLVKAIMDTFTTNKAQAFAPGQKFELPPVADVKDVSHAAGGNTTIKTVTKAA
jgi:hypothetical protein